jgi:hypothetical protein
LFFYFFLKLLSAQISKNLGFMASFDVEECRGRTHQKLDNS